MIQTYLYNIILALCYLYFHHICVIVKYVNFATNWKFAFIWFCMITREDSESLFCNILFVLTIGFGTNCYDQ
jgi:hypothetical protein